MRTRSIIWIAVAGAIAWYLFKLAQPKQTPGILQQRREQLQLVSPDYSITAEQVGTQRIN